MNDDELYDLLVQAFQAGQNSMLEQYLPTSMRHQGALSHADRVLADIRGKEHVESEC